MLEPAEVKAARRALGLTQAQLAARAGVSQSFVAKLEAGALDPSFSAMKRISLALESARRAGEKKVIDVMHRGVVAVSPADLLKKAAQLMRARGISQLPVLVRGRPVGMVTEADLLAALADGRAGPVGGVMGDAPPTIAPSAGVRAVGDLLRWWPIIIVAERGRIVGVVTKSDLLGAL
jgi:predicted transcriptional regulator